MGQGASHPDFVADLVLSGGTIVTGLTRYRADVAIKDGLIALVGAPGAMPAARETVDVSGKFLLPGAIDVHVHFREPGYTHKEDWGTGTAAAAMGGTTTVFEMPNTHPPTRSVVELRQKQAAAAKAHVDYGLYGLLAEDNIDELPGLIAGGVNAFKCFMGNTFGNLPSPSTGAMLEGFEIIAPSGLRISLHAETASIMAWRQQRLMAAGRNDPLAHIAARPAIVAAEAVSRAANSRNGPARASMCCISPPRRNCAPLPMPRHAAWRSRARPAPATSFSTRATMRGSARSSGSIRPCGRRRTPKRSGGRCNPASST